MNHIIFAILQCIKKINYYSYGYGDNDGSLDDIEYYPMIGEKDDSGNGQLITMHQKTWASYQTGDGDYNYHTLDYLQKERNFFYDCATND